MSLLEQGFRKDVGGEVHTQSFTASTAGAAIDIGAFPLKSVQLVDGGSFGGSADIQVSNDGANWVTAAGGGTLGAGVLVNITEDARKARIDPTVSAGELIAIWCLSG